MRSKNHRTGTGVAARSHFEPLEPRQLLSADGLTTIKSTIDAQGAEAQWGYQTTQGVIVNMDISMERHTIIQSGVPVQTQSISVTIAEFDTVNFFEPLVAQGFSDTFVETDAPGLQSIHVQGQVTVGDQVNDTHFVLSIDLTWQATSPWSTTNDVTDADGVKESFHGKTEVAVATGSVTPTSSLVGVFNAGDNFAQQPSFDGSIARSTDKTTTGFSSVNSATSVLGTSTPILN